MSRTDVVNVGKMAMDVRKSVALMPYSRVIITVDEETEFAAGNETGLTLELSCPWGTQAMANNILSSILGYQYQPYTATNAMLDPAAEMGDAVNANGVYGGLYQQDIIFDNVYYSNVAAPEDEQLDHEYTYETPTERRITRQTAWTKAEFRITNAAIEAEVSAREADGREFRATLSAHAQEISARVTQTGGSQSSFGWSLLSTAFILYSGNKAVFTCDSSGISVDGSITARSGYIGNGSSGFTIGNTYIKNGKNSPTDNNSGVYIGTNGIGVGNGVFSVDTSGNLKVKGRVEATSGYIGNGSNGFEIGSTFIRNGMTSYSDTAHNGVFVGTNGIALGKGNFKVDSAGNLYANSGTFNGTIRADKIYGQIVNSQIGDGAVSGGKIQNGAVSGGKISDGAVSGGKISDGAVGSSKISDGAVGSSKIGSGAVSKSKTSSGVQSSLDNGDTAKASFDSLTSGSIRASRINCTSLGVYSNFYLDDHGQTTVVWKNVKDGDGNTVRLLGQR